MQAAGEEEGGKEEEKEGGKGEEKGKEGGKHAGEMIKIVVNASCKQLAQISLSWLLHALVRLWKNIALKHIFEKHSLSSKQD